MKFCIHCGEKNAETAEFCTNCGKPLDSTADQPAAVHNTATEPIQHDPPVRRTSPSSPKEPMKKSTKVLLVTAGVLALCLLTTHVVLGKVYDPMKKLNAMDAAYNAKDKDAFFKEFSIPDDTIGNAENFYELISGDGWIPLRERLTYESNKIANKEPMDMNNDASRFISVKNKPILWGLYNEMDYIIHPTAVTIQAPLANTKLKFGGKEVTSTFDEESLFVGQFIPGEYEWSYELTDGILPLAGEGTYTVYADEMNEHDLDIEWGFKTLYLSSDLEDAIIHVNGKSTNKTVAELAEWYPAQASNAVKIQAVTTDKDGKEVKSSVLALDSPDLYLKFDHIEQEEKLAENLDSVKNTYENFRSDYATAIYYADFSYISRYFKEGTEIRKDYAEFVTDHRTIPGYEYEFILNDVTSVTPLTDSSYELLSFEKFNFSSDAEGPIRYDRKKKYVITENEGTFYIDEITDLDTKKTKL